MPSRSWQFRIDDILEAIRTTKPSEVVDQQPQELDVDKLGELINNTVSSQLTAKYEEMPNIYAQCKIGLRLTE